MAIELYDVFVEAYEDSEPELALKRYHVYNLIDYVGQLNRKRSSVFANYSLIMSVCSEQDDYDGEAPLLMDGYKHAYGE